MAQRVAGLEGVFGRQAAGGAGLVVDCRFRTGGFGFQVVLFCHFRREVVSCHFAICAAAGGAGGQFGAGGCAAGAVIRLGVAAVSSADTGVGAVAVGLPSTPIVIERGNGHVFGCAFCPVGCKGSLVSAKAVRQAGRFGDHCIGCRDGLGFHVGLVRLADALCGAGIAGLGGHPGVFRCGPVMAGGGKGDVFGLCREAKRIRERCGVRTDTCIQASRRFRHSVGHFCNIRDITGAIIAFFICSTHIAVRNLCPRIVWLAPVMAEDIAGFKGCFIGSSLGCLVTSCAGLVVDCLCGTSRGGFQILFLYLFCCEVVGCHFAIRKGLAVIFAHFAASAGFVINSLRRAACGRFQRRIFDNFLGVAVGMDQLRLDLITAFRAFDWVFLCRMSFMVGCMLGECIVRVAVFAAVRVTVLILIAPHIRIIIVVCKRAVFPVAGRADSLVLTVHRAAVMRGFLCFYMAAGILFPMLTIISLPVAQSAAVVGGIQLPVFFATGRANRSLHASGFAAAVGVGSAGFQLQLLFRIVFHVASGIIGGEIFGIVCFVCSREYA